MAHSDPTVQAAEPSPNEILCQTDDPDTVCEETQVTPTSDDKGNMANIKSLVRSKGEICLLYRPASTELCPQAHKTLIPQPLLT